MLFGLLVSVAANAMQPSAEQATPSAEPIDRNCTDDRGVDRCSPEQQRRVIELFGMRPIEEHAAAGDQVRRAFYVDGYGRDMIAIAFVRAPGRDPTLFVHFPETEEGRSPPAEALVPAGVWEEVLDRSVHFDRELVSPPAPKAESGAMVICIHSWVYTVEASDPASKDAPSRPRRDVEDACENGLGEAYASALAELALPLLPYCAALDPRQHRNTVSLLRACEALRGDRLAAAEAYNQAMSLRLALDRDSADDVDRLFATPAVLVWDGQRFDRPADELTRRVREMRSTLFLENAEGEGPDRSRVTGVLHRWADDEGEAKDVQAPVILRFRSRYSGAEPVIERIEVGPFEPVPEP